jgi:FKBP-type peptidyl-prolyl cis-trans isomerase
MQKALATSAAGIFGHAKVIETVMLAASLRKEVIVAGSGTEKPTPGANVKAHYVGKLLDGTDFDSSRKRGRPFTFDIGQGRVSGLKG